MRYILATLLFFIACAQSYSPNAEVYVSNSATGNGISIRWIGKEIIYREGVTIYRKEKSKDWVKLKVVFPPKVLPNHPSFTPKQQEFFSSYLTTEKEEFKEGFIGIFMAMESIENYEYAKGIGIAFDDETAVKGKKYDYKVEGKVNNEKQLFGEVNIKCEDYSPMQAPQEFTIDRKKKRTTLVWKNEVGKYYTYNVYMKDKNASDWKQIVKDGSSGNYAKLQTAYFLTIPTSKDTAYQFKIEANDYFGQKSAMSKVFEVIVEDLDAPAIPEFTLLPHSGKKTVQISWDKPLDKDVASYDIYRSIEDEDSLFQKVGASTSPLTDTVYLDKLENSGVYFYKIIAVDQSGNSTISFVQVADVYDVTPPAIPNALTAIADTGKLILNWGSVNDSDLKGYLLYRSVADEDNSDNLFVRVTTATLDTNYYIEEIAKNVRNKFVYVVRSIDMLLNESESSNEAFAQLPDVTPPVAPFIKRSYEENNGLAINWMPNVDADLKGYNLVKKRKGDTTNFEQVNFSLIPKTIKVYVDREAERGIIYEYRLQAIDNSNLASEFSNTVLAKLNFLEMAGEVVFLKEKLNANKQEVTIEWSTDSLINESVKGTAVYKAVNEGNLLPLTKINTTTKFKEKLTQEGTYRYQVRVFGVRGSVLKSKEITIEFKKTK